MEREEECGPPASPLPAPALDAAWRRKDRTTRRTVSSPRMRQAALAGRMCDRFVWLEGAAMVTAAAGCSGLPLRPFGRPGALRLASPRLDPVCGPPGGGGGGGGGGDRGDTWVVAAQSEFMASAGANLRQISLFIYMFETRSEKWRPRIARY